MAVAPSAIAQSNQTSEGVALVITIVILIGMSNFPVTQRAAFWITLFMFCVAVLSLFSSGQAAAIGKELTSNIQGAKA